MADEPFTFGMTTALFPAPLLVYKLDDAERLNAALHEEIDQRRAAEPGVSVSNRAGWHSESDFFRRCEPAHARVSNAITLAVADATRRSRDPQAPPIHVRMTGWINVNPPGAYNVPHDHPGSFWSGCYYVRTDPVRRTDDDGGAITFIDSRCPPSGQALMNSPLFAGSHTLRPLPGTLLVFPGNLKHWVHPNSWDQDRVTVAFNASLRAAAENTAGP